MDLLDKNMTLPKQVFLQKSIQNKSIESKEDLENSSEFAEDILDQIFSSKMTETESESDFEDKENYKYFKNKDIEDLPPIHDLKSEYKVGDVLGKGSFSVVKKLVRKSDGKRFALKLYKDKNTFSTARGEGHILKLLKHPGIIKFERFYIKQNKVKI